MLVLPHAGGTSHFYKGLKQYLPERIDPFFHDYPGHGRRSNKPLLTTMEEVVDDVITAAGAAGVFGKGETWAIFGHSMGARVAHAVIAERLRKELSCPALFFASGASPPSLPPTENFYSVHGTSAPRRVSRLPVDLFWSRMAGYGNIPEELTKHPNIVDYFETLLRNDFSIIERHKPDTTPIDLPIHVFYGNRDRYVVSSLDKWAEMSLSPPHYHSFDGNHFFVLKHLKSIGEIIGHAVRK